MPKRVTLLYILIAASVMSATALAWNAPSNTGNACEPSGRSVEGLFAPSLTKECIKLENVMR
ncbi:hypothetical protein HNR29_005482 [Rhizobium leguminosarum]|nr:hypothetical protein [Rhizobium leguminosarum]